MLSSSQMFGSYSSEQGHERMISELVHSGSPQMAQISLPPVDPILNHIDVDQVSVKELAGDSCLMLEAASKAHMSQMHVSGNLMRYHSAPSSMLAGIVDEFFCKGSTHLSQVADVEFAQQFLADDVSVTSNHCDTAVVQTITSAPEGQAPHQQCEQQPELRSIDQANHIKVEHQQSRFRTISGNGIAEDVSPLSAIFQHSQEGNSDNFGSSMMAIPCKIPIESSTLFPATGYTPTSHAGSNLIRHNSSPGGLLSRIATEILESNCVSRAPVECSPYRNPNETVFASAANGSNLVSAFGLSNCHNGRISNKENNDLNKFEASKSGILRQSSSPAGLLSQLSLEGIMEDGNALGTHSPSQRCFKDDAFLKNFGGAWDDAFSTSEAMIHGVHNDSTFAARKRNRYLNAKMFSCSQLSDCMIYQFLSHGRFWLFRDIKYRQHIIFEGFLEEIETLEQGVSLQGQVTLPTVTSPESQLTVDKGLSDAVLCRARAKRGYATHPRSIAERVRRTKISERMKKLQELVPNMDKQTNTAEMLDEAVEYIKSLQRQIQELSEKQSSCDGSCRQK